MSNSSGLKLRILSALVMIPVATAVIWFGKEVFVAFLVVISALMSWEWSRIAGAQSKTAWVMMAVFLAGAIVSVGLNLPLLAILVLIMFGAILIFAFERHAGMHARILMFGGMFYISAALLSASWLRMHTEGAFLFLWLAAMVVATDIGAYVAGRTIGGFKLAPSISPNKTWAGLFGGMIAASIASLVFANYMAENMLIAILLGFVTAIVAQMGDLLESWMKRKTDLKDSSGLIPGHGGILDRLDGFLAATPAFAFYIYYISLIS